MTMIVFPAAHFSLAGAIWLLYLREYNFSIAVWVGVIALAGLDAETAVVRLLYRDVVFENSKKKRLMRTLSDLREAIYEGAVRRIRPKVMTVGTTFVGLLPIMWSTAAGFEVMKRIAVPMAWKLFTSLLLELTVYSIICS